LFIHVLLNYPFLFIGENKLKHLLQDINIGGRRIYIDENRHRHNKKGPGKTGAPGISVISKNLIKDIW